MASPASLDPVVDRAAAREAADQTRALSRRLREALEERERLAAVARQQWQGAAREHFDQQFNLLQHRGAELAAQLATVAAALDETADHAAR